MKLCCRCKIASKHKKDNYCKECRTIVRLTRRRNYHEEIRLNERKNEYRTKYGITLEDYESMYLEQNGKCKICFSKTSGRKSGIFLVDHDHSTGKVRGLLCARCNVGLGNFDEDRDRMLRAIRYVEKEGVL